jgi:hypothetical protein
MDETLATPVNPESLERFEHRVALRFEMKRKAVFTTEAGL